MRGTRAKQIRSKIMTHDEFIFLKKNKESEIKSKITPTFYLQGPIRLYRIAKKVFKNPDMALPIY